MILFLRESKSILLKIFKKLNKSINNKVYKTQKPVWVKKYYSKRYLLKINTFKLFFLHNFFHFSSVLILDENDSLRKLQIPHNKLKYTRTPSFDIVSSGIAALFSAFLGAMICDKFGMELLDSADFFIIYIFCISILLPLNAILSVVTLTDELYTPFIKPWIILFFLLDLIYFFSVNWISSFFKK